MIINEFVINFVNEIASKDINILIRRENKIQNKVQNSHTIQKNVMTERN